MQPRIDFQKRGGQVIQFFPASIFYESPLCFCQSVALRGGQPVLFPQFADRGALKKHGFARDVAWELVSDVREFTRHRVILMREFVAGEFVNWPHEARLALDIECSSDIVKQTLIVENIGKNSFTWTGGVHPYFAVHDLMTAKLYGLMGASYTDRYAPERPLSGEDVLRWSEAPCEKLFNVAPGLILDTGSCKIKLETSGFDQWMVWNPGKEGAKALEDLPDADWNKFVCVEPVCVDRPVLLKPGEKFVGKFNISFAFSGGVGDACASSYTA